MDETRSSSTHTAEMISNADSYSNSRAENDFLVPVINGEDQEASASNHNGRYVIRWKSGEKVDQKLLKVLEIFSQEIYCKRREFFKKIFPELQDQFTEVFKKIGTVLLKNKNQNQKYQTMQRSLSLGSQGTSKQRQDQGLSALMFERFKVKTVAHDHEGPSRTSGDDELGSESGSRLEGPVLRYEIAGHKIRSEPKPERFKVKTQRGVIIAKPEGRGDHSGNPGTSSSKQVHSSTTNFN